jgi:DNA-binding NarL/FixJ family response regulator
VVLASLEPIVALGLQRSLLSCGIEAIIEWGRPSQVAALAGRLQPYAVVLGLEPETSRSLQYRIRRAAPDAKVVLLARDEDAAEVLDPGAEHSRRISEAVADRLASELRHPSTAPTRSSSCPTT